MVAVNPTYHDIHMEARLPDQQAEDRRRSVIVQLPPRLQCQHSTSLAKLTPEGWRLAEVAAVMPQPFVFEVVAQVMGKPVADLVPALRDALSAGVIVPTPSALTFRHDRVRQAMYEQVPAPLRLALLRRVERLGPEIGIGTAAEAQEVGEAQDSSLVDCDMADRHMAGRSNYVSAAGPATPTPATSADLAESETGISVSGSVVGWAVPGDLAVARAGAESILGDAHGPGIDGSLAAALSTLGFIAWSEGRVADALSHQRASVSRALRNGSLIGSLRPRFGLAAVCTAVGDVRQAHNAILGIEATARMLGETGWLAAAPILRARLSTVMGSPGAAAAEASTALELEGQHGPTIFSAAAFLVMAAEALNNAGLADVTVWLDRLADQPSGARAVLGQASVLWVEAHLAGARFGAAAAHEAMGAVHEAPSEPCPSAARATAVYRLVGTDGSRGRRHHRRRAGDGLRRAASRRQRGVPPGGGACCPRQGAARPRRPGTRAVGQRTPLFPGTGGRTRRRRQPPRPLRPARPGPGAVRTGTGRVRADGGQA